eukprot:FR740188.1.p1 GENE.FR740188.1~~FR740188.1.p1  ORF type:complete len:213 (+),score=24.62 FR740188.1:71-640(+)
MVDDPWLTARHISGDISCRIDFAIKRRKANEWCFVEFLALDSLLYDPVARKSGLAKVMAEKPVIALEPLQPTMEGRNSPLSSKGAGKGTQGTTAKFFPPGNLGNMGPFPPQGEFSTLWVTRPTGKCGVYPKPTANPFHWSCEIHGATYKFPNTLPARPTSTTNKFKGKPDWKGSQLQPTLSLAQTSDGQ